MAAAHRRTRHRARVLGPVLSVFAVLLVTAPATWLTLRTDHGSGLADRIPAEYRTSARDDAARAASRGGPRPAATENRDKAPGKAKASTAPRTPASSTPRRPKPTRTTSTPTPTMATPTPTKPTAKPTKKPRPTPTRTTTSTPPPAPPSTSTPPPTGGGSSTFETEVVRLTNAERAKNGCGALSIDSALTTSAGKHASDMVARHYFDHTNPDGKDPFERMADAGFRGSAMAENIAMGYDSPQAAVTGWMNSAGHRTNILNCGYNRIGVGYDSGQILDGYSKGSWVQNFGTR